MLVTPALVVSSSSQFRVKKVAEIVLPAEQVPEVRARRDDGPDIFAPGFFVPQKRSSLLDITV